MSKEKNPLNKNNDVIPKSSSDYGATKSQDTTNIVENDQLNAEIEIEDYTNFFRDGIRRIDFMIVYSILHSDGKGEEGQKEGKVSETGKKELKRKIYLENLVKAGVQLEEEYVEKTKKKIVYIKVHIPWDLMCLYAEDMMIHSPILIDPESDVNSSDRVLSFLHIPNLMKIDVPNHPQQYFNCQFKKDKITKYIGSDDEDRFFKVRDRGRVAYEILSKTLYGVRKKAEVGIDRMIETGIFIAAFPLHTGDYKVEMKSVINNSKLNPRQILFEYWARWSRWCHYQPLDHIRDYFGEKIAIYFAWLGFYTAWLLPASIVGFLVFIYGIITMAESVDTKETCDSHFTYYMCPLCDVSIGCEYWYLSTACLFTKIAYLFDNSATVFFSIFMSFWAVTFLEYWKRRTAFLAYHWDVLDFESEEEKPRPDYVAKCNTYETNPITGIKEPYFPQRTRIPRIISGLGVVVMMVFLVLIFIVAVIMYRVLIPFVLSKTISKSSLLNKRSTVFASVSAALLNLFIILILGKFYEKLAKKITEWEMHRTQTEFEDQLTFKVFVFQFINFYSSIIYIGFFKGKFVGYPGNYNTLMGLRQEECRNGSCLIELALNLAVIMVGKQIINNVQEVVVPKLKAFLQRWRMGRNEKNVVRSRWEEDFELINNEGLFEEYLEMVMQFGFITIFVAAFPLAPLFALLNNWLEIRLDANKFICETRRPVAERCKDIGVWFSILQGLAQLAVVSNAFLIAFTSEYLPRLLYKVHNDFDLHGYINHSLAWATNGSTEEECRYKDYRDDKGARTFFFWELLCARLAFIIIFEHTVFGICKLIDLMVPDIPESLDVKIKRERYLAKQALANAQIIMNASDALEETNFAEEPDA